MVQSLLPNYSNGADLNTATSVMANKTFAIKDNKIAGFIDGKEAIRQAIFLMLNTERYKHVIYSWNYGHEVNSLIGKDRGYIEAELPRLVEECLTQDDRISDVQDFTFTFEGDSLFAEFKAMTTEGIVESEVVL